MQQRTPRRPTPALPSSRVSRSRRRLSCSARIAGPRRLRRQFGHRSGSPSRASRGGCCTNPSHSRDVVRAPQRRLGTRGDFPPTPNLGSLDEDPRCRRRIVLCGAHSTISLCNSLRGKENRCEGSAARLSHPTWGSGSLAPATRRLLLARGGRLARPRETAGLRRRVLARRWLRC